MRRNAILATGVAAVLSVVALSGCGSEKEDPYVKQLKQEVRVYSGQIDSLHAVVEGYDARLRSIRSQLDTAHTANQQLVASLQKVTGELKEYRRLYSEQKALNTKLQGELQQVGAERDRSIARARQMKARADSLDNELYVQRSRMARLEARLEASLKREAGAQKAVSAVFIYADTKETLEKAGYLKVKQTTIITDAYTLVGFPDVKDARVKQTAVGKTLVLDGELQFLVDRHGKLKKDTAYIEERTADGRTRVTFLDNILEGQRILAVVKREKRT